MIIDLPTSLTAYFNAKRAYDTDALLATLTADAVIADDGSIYSGSTAIREWNARASKAVKATYDLTAAERVDQTFVLTVVVAGNFPTSPVTLYFYATLRGEKIAAMTILERRIPNPVAAYIAATNTFDTKALADAFMPGALVNDVKREFRGTTAIEHWFERESVANGVTMAPTEIWEHAGNVTVRAALNGTYDKTGLPDPLVLTYYFSTTAEKITQLIILLNEPPAA